MAKHLLKDGKIAKTSRAKPIIIFFGFSAIGTMVSVCSIQTWEEKVIASLLTVAYYETSEIREKIKIDQKTLFNNESRKSLERKGLGTDKL